MKTRYEHKAFYVGINHTVRLAISKINERKFGPFSSTAHYNTEFIIGADFFDHLNGDMNTVADKIANAYRSNPVDVTHALKVAKVQPYKGARLISGYLADQKPL